MMKIVVKILLSMLAVLLLAVAALVIFVNINTKPLEDVSPLVAALETLSPKSVKVAGVKLYTHPDGYTCGVTTVSVVVSFCQSKDLPPQALIAKYSLSGGMNFTKFVDVLSQGLLFGAANPYNKPYHDFHASVVTGIDLEQQRVDITNVYGYEEHISLVEFLNRMSYRGTKGYPLVQRTVIKLGLMAKNAVVILTRK